MSYRPCLYFLYNGTKTIIPEAIMENTTIKSTFLLINSTMHKPIHNRIRHTNLNMAYPFIASYFLQRYYVCCKKEKGVDLNIKYIK